MSRNSTITTTLLAAMLIVPRAAYAEWSNFQLQQAVHVEEAPMRGTVCYFMAPKDDVDILFLYLGPKVEIGDHFWFSPQVGGVGNFGGHDYALGSLWLNVNASGWNIFFEEDAWVGLGLDPVWYTYGTVDYSITDAVAAGLVTEGVDDVFAGGPQVSLAKKLSDAATWVGGLQLYLGHADDALTTSVRVTSMLFF